MKTTSAIILLIITLSSFIIGCSGADTESSESEEVIYELRTYTTHDGKLDDLHTRFENHTMAFFEKHGMTNIAYWSPGNRELKDNTLIYLLSHESREAAVQSWEAFSADEKWQEVFQASRSDGPIVQRVESVYMNKTPYSP